jgi:UDP-N-acetylglucosamine:LPS N-acetylglucosamine transferase
VRYLTEHDAAVRARTSKDLGRVVRELLRDTSRRERMSAAIQQIAKPRAAEDVAVLIESLRMPQEAYA